MSTKKRRAAFVENEVSRWNRPDPVRKRCADLMEQIRTYLAHVNETDLIGYARLVYLRNATKNPELAKEFAAITNEASLFAFIDRWEGIDDSPLDIVELERVEREGLDWKGQQQ